MLNFMEIKDINAHYRAQEEERAALPWYIRIPVNVGEYIRYRIWGYIENFPRELKWDYQRFIRGYSEVDVWNLNSFIIDKIHEPLNKFVKHQEEHGMSLPIEFQSDPGAWLVVLSKIKFSVDHAWKDEHELDYNPTKGMGIDEVAEFKKKVDEGFLLLGKYLRDLWD